MLLRDLPERRHSQAGYQSYHSRRHRVPYFLDRSLRKLDQVFGYPRRRIQKLQRYLSNVGSSKVRSNDLPTVFNHCTPFVYRSLF